MKIAITCIFGNIVYNKRNHRGLEAFYVHQMFAEKDHEVHLIGSKNRNTKDLDFYINYSDADWDSYDMVFVQLSTPNFFGGQYSDHTLPIATALTGVPMEKIAFLVNDPRIDVVNPSRALARFDIASDIEEDWDMMIDECVYWFPGKDIKQFLGREPKNWRNANWFWYMFRNHLEINDEVSTTEKEYDLVYYGDKRGPFREKQLRKYFPDDTSNLLIGYKSNKVPGDFVKKQKHDLLLQTLEKCKVSLITGDEEHLNNVTTFRFYETMASNCLAAIQIEYDPNKEIIQDPVLRDLLYVESADDVKKLIAAYSPELVQRQKDELKRIFEYDLSSDRP